MAANDELPRGWSLNAFNTGTTAVIVIPAVQNIIHVLDTIAFRLTDNLAAISENAFVLDGATVILTFQLFAPTVQIPDDIQWNGPLAGSVATSLTIEFGGSTANTIEEIHVTGHDV